MYRGGCRACILPNIQRKNRRDIDGKLGTSALLFEGIALCVAKPLESSVLECRHNMISKFRGFWLAVFLEFLISSSRPYRSYLHLSISMLIFFKVESKVASCFKYSTDFIALPRDKGLSRLLTFVTPMCNRSKLTFNSLIFCMYFK